MASSMLPCACSTLQTLKGASDNAVVAVQRQINMWRGGPRLWKGRQWRGKLHAALRLLNAAC